MRPLPRTALLTLIQRFEGDGHSEHEASRTTDPAGNYEIGWGHKLIGPADPLWDAQISRDEADALALEDLGKIASQLAVSLGSNTLASLNDNQYAAVLDFAYNEGPGKFAGSTLCHFICTGRWGQVPSEFERWVFAKVDGIETELEGLVKRRQAEARLWLTP